MILKKNWRDVAVPESVQSCFELSIHLSVSEPAVNRSKNSSQEKNTGKLLLTNRTSMCKIFKLFEQEMTFRRHRQCIQLFQLTLSDHSLKLKDIF